MSLSSQITNITKEIEGLDKTVSLKTKVSKYNTISNKIADANIYLNELNIDIKPDMKECDEKEYSKLIDKIEKIDMEDLLNNNNMELEDMIKKYKQMCKDINKCENYLNNKKMEIIHDK